ncbi:MAG: aldo/keto reductase [Myxococcota bacterium]|jgi:aryl-alcohol dehydrogenase-like predicted oxidoreductase|nr:aldo/keto reductase [Myxococcota bacterium]
MKTHRTAQIALGTVAFGLDYGISNPQGQVQPEHVQSILEYAAQEGIDTLDTAAAYGQSETVLGAMLAKQPSAFDVVSKLPPKIEGNDVGKAIADSLTKLGLRRAKAFLAHDMESFKDPLVRESLLRAKDEGHMGQYGVSVYYPDDVRWLLDNDIAFDLIQFPLNVFDQRFRPLLPLLKANNVEVHTRSVFLQGLFFLDPAALPTHFSPVHDRIVALNQLAASSNIPLSALLLNMAQLHEAIDKVVIGVASLEELRENVEAHQYIEKTKAILEEIHAFALQDEHILLPFHWRT